MKKVFTAILIAVSLMTATAAHAQLKFGLKGGLNVTSMSFSESVIEKSNQTGFFIGPTVKFTLPLVGLGIDVAAVYDQRNAEAGAEGEDITLKQRSINIPINLRYNIGLGSMAGVYIAAGPQFGFNIGDKTFSWDDYTNYSMSESNFSINVGAGVSLIQHLEIGVTYNIACGKTGEVNVWDVASNTWSQFSKGRASAWQISAAYYF